MQELKNATPKVIWSDSTASRCCNVCEFCSFLVLVVDTSLLLLTGAPEIHWKSTEGAWYMSVQLYVMCSVLNDTVICRYYVAGTSDTLDNQHIHVLKGSSTDIWESTWSYESTRMLLLRPLSKNRYFQPVLSYQIEMYGRSIRRF